MPEYSQPFGRSFVMCKARQTPDLPVKRSDKKTKITIRLNFNLIC